MGTAFRNALASNNGAGAATLTATLPSGVQDGDTLLMSVAARGGSNTDFGPYKLGNVLKTHQTVLRFTPDGTKLVVVSAGNDLTVDTVTVSTDAKVTSPNCSNYPYSVAVTNSYAYIPNAAGNSVNVLRFSDNTIVATIASAGGWGCVLNNAGTYLYVLGEVVINKADIEVVRLSDNTLVTNCSFAASTGQPTVSMVPEGIAITADDSEVWAVVNYDTPSGVWVMRTSDNTIINGPIQCGSSPRSIYRSPDGSEFWVTNYGDSTVSVISQSSKTVTNTISVTDIPWGAAFTPDGAYFVVCCGKALTSHKLVVIRVSDHTVVGTSAELGSGGGAYITILSDNNTVYIPRYGGSDSGGIDVVDISTKSSPTWVRRIEAGKSPWQLAMKSDDSEYWVGHSYGQTRLPHIKKSEEWNQLSRVDSTTVLSQKLFWRKANSEPSSYTVNLSASQPAACAIAAVSGAVAPDTAPDPAAFAGQANASSVNDAAPALGTFAAANGIDFGFFATAYASSFTPPGSYTEPGSSDTSAGTTSGGVTVEACYQEVSGATTMPSMTAVAVDAAVNIGYHVFVSGGTPAPLPPPVVELGTAERNLNLQSVHDPALM